MLSLQTYVTRLFVSFLEDVKACGVKFVQSFHLQQRLKIENLCQISVTCLPQPHSVNFFPRD